MYDIIINAEKILNGIAHQTPVLTSSQLNNKIAGKVFLKCENFQRIGAFKFRGAYYAIHNLNEKQKKHGIITYSSGNHAQAVALSSAMLGCKATILMPKDASHIKVNAVRGYGADIIFYDRFHEDRSMMCQQLVEQNGYTFIPPYNHVDIIAGQGTVAKELLNYVKDLDYLFVPCGGGGLLSGCSIVARAISPLCRVIGVEPTVSNVGTQSFNTGIIQHIVAPTSIADGLNSVTIGDLTFPIIQKNVDHFVNVTESQIINAMYFLWTRMKIVAEPSGATTIAAIMYGGLPLKNKRVGAVISGGNVDILKLLPVLQQYLN